MGAIIYICMESEVKVELLTPTQARKLLSGDGRLKKEQIANFIRENYIDLGEFSGKAGKGKNSDLYDSLVVSFAWNKQNNLNEKWNK